ncbi:unnamed protein product [Symbiodinium sp. CCMP2592]|nr:unnamed protein product [Symbiodinium sp. CCMP2592]
MACPGQAAELGVSGFVHEMGRTAVTARLFIEACAGSCRLSRATAAAGIPTWSFEVTRGGPNEDILRPECLELLLSYIRKGLVACLWLGLTCASWSRARRGKRRGPIDPAARGLSARPKRGGFPAPLRSREYLWGLPRSELTTSELKKLDHGNALAKWAIKVVKEARKYGTTLIVENPRTSWIWELPELKELMSGPDFNFGTFHHCQFGQPWKKATSLAMWGKFSGGPGHLAKILRTCKSRRCSVTGKKHERLQGFVTGPKAKGKTSFKTSQAAAYPQEFCKAFAQLLVDSLDR